MKIIVITKHYVNNYGSVLQTYATQELLGQTGGQVYIANYMLPGSAGMKTADMVLRRYSSGSRVKKFVLKAVLLPTIVRWKRVFGGFLKKYLNVYGSPTDQCDVLAEELPEADIYCTGSDQVWNPKTNKGLKPAYFCEFAPEGKKVVSLAASFGQTDMGEEDQERLKKYLRKYCLLSVREKSGVEILNRTGYSSREILDPAMIMTAEFWKKLAAGRRIKKDYILIYQLNTNKEFDRYAARAAEKLGKKLVRICTRYDQAVKNGKSVLIPSVEEWLALFYYADLVITDSFHGTVFSILFQKEFVNLYPPQFAERLKSLLSLFGLERRYVSDYNSFDILGEKIDYESVNKILDCKRKDAQEFIGKILSE